MSIEIENVSVLVYFKKGIKSKAFRYMNLQFKFFWFFPFLSPSLSVSLHHCLILSLYRSFSGSFPFCLILCVSIPLCLVLSLNLSSLCHSVYVSFPLCLIFFSVSFSLVVSFLLCLIPFLFHSPSVLFPFCLIPLLPYFLTISFSPSLISFFSHSISVSSG